MLETCNAKSKARRLQANTQVQELSQDESVPAKGTGESGTAPTGELLLQRVLPLPPQEEVEVLHPEPPVAVQHGKRSGAVEVRWETGIGNVLTVYSHADRWDREFGMSAYENYKEKILAISGGDEKGIGVFAALSPNIDEAANFLGLRRMLVGETPVPGYPQNIEKAKRILEGVDPLRVLVGLKTRAFYLNILRPWDVTNPIVVDAHMYSVWKLKRHGVTHVDINPKVYHQISRDFAKAADMVGVRPNQLQATCWTTWKRRNNIVFKGHQPGLEW